MEPSDLNLLELVPPYHLQVLIKSRRLASKGQPASVSSDPSSMTVSEVAAQLFQPASISEVLHGLSEIEQLILRELVACGGRANSRDLALYFTRSGLLKGTSPVESYTDSPAIGQRYSSVEVPQYPSPHPHGIFELALRRLLLLGLLFWGRQTNFGGRDYTSGVYDGVVIVPQTVIEVVLSDRLSEARTQLGKGAYVEAERSGAGLGAYVEAERSGADIASGVGDIASGVGVGGLDKEVAKTQHMGASLESSQEQDLNGSVDILSDGVRTLQRTLYLYWSLAAGTREGLPLVSSGFLSRPALRQVLEQLGTLVLPASTMPMLRGNSLVDSIRLESEVPHLLFLRLLLMQLGLLRERQGSLQAAPAEAFFRLPLLERTRRCYHAWFETPFWNELVYLPEVSVRPGPMPLDPAHEEVIHSRQTVVERILCEQAGVWCEFSTFIAHTKLHAPYLLFPRSYGPRTERYSMGSNPYGWDFRLRHGWLTHREGWHLVEGGFIRAVVSGPLHWLGVVDVNDEHNPTAFRLSRDITLVAGADSSSIVEPPVGRLIVQPNFELVALAPVSEALLIRLDRFAERTGLEHIAQYRITRASVTRAIQMGLHAEDIQQTIEQASAGEIPQNVQYSLLEWERQARRIELWRSATLFEVDDAALLDALFADEETRPLLGRRLAPTLAEVPHQQLSALQDALWQRDYLPALTSASVYDAPLESAGTLPGWQVMSEYEAQWRLGVDGLLEPLYAVLDLYLVTELERFSELDMGTSWRRITPASLQQARSAGLQLEQVIRFLQHYCEGGIPPSFLIRLKLWGGGYDAQSLIQVEPAPLLALSPQLLQDLRADSELQELLGAEVTQARRLVHVAPDKLERLVELLRERGFEVG